MDFKDSFMAMFEHQQQEETRLIDAFGAVEQSNQGTLDHWSLKDIFAHIGYWNGLMAETLNSALEGETPEPYGELDEVNAEVFERNRTLPWSRVLNRRANAFNDLVTVIKLLSEEALTDPLYFAWQNGRPLWQSVLFVTYLHDMRHLSDYYREKGDHQLADNIQERAAALQMEINRSSTWAGTVLYNLACYYSVSGEAAKAIENLELAFDRNPQLIEWSKEDPDINPIREHAAYQALLKA